MPNAALHSMTLRPPVAVSTLTLILLLAILVTSPQARSESAPAVQVFEGTVEPRLLLMFVARGLAKGDRLEVHAVGTSGSLDPSLAVLGEAMSVEDLISEAKKARSAAIDRGLDMHEADKSIANRLFLAWDDDSGPGYGAKTSITIPEDGDYRILLSGGLGLFDPEEIARVTAGEYRLTASLNAPISAFSQDKGTPFLELDLAQMRTTDVQRVSGETTPETPTVEYPLYQLQAGDTLYAWIEGTQGANAPRLRLLDFGGKQLQHVNANADQPSAEFSYQATETTSALMLSVEGDEDKEMPYTLVIGRNAPEVQKGKGEKRGRPIVRPPIEVQVAVELEQITNVNQKEENFSVVAAIDMRWRDPRFAFSPDSCECRRLLLDEDGFKDFLSKRNLNWPRFVISNQQGPRWPQRQVFEVAADGNVSYFERFTTTLQAPEFDFRLFPLDKQTFYIRIEGIVPIQEYVFVADEERSALGRKLGEEEWLVTHFAVSAYNWGPEARFIYRFEAQRHIVYYLLRFFVPILLIILIGWFTFSLQDYAKRTDIAAGNLLLFIAFSFTIANDLPRLGYVTFIDMLLIVAFAVGASLVVLNMYLRGLETAGRMELVSRIHPWALWLYPLAYIAPLVAVYLWRI